MATLPGNAKRYDWNAAFKRESPIDPYFVWFDWTTQSPNSDAEAKNVRIDFMVEVAVDPRSDDEKYLECLRLLVSVGFLPRGPRGGVGSWPRFLTGSVSQLSITRFLDSFVAHGTKLLRWEVSLARLTPDWGDQFNTALTNWIEPQKDPRLARTQETDAPSVPECAAPGPSPAPALQVRSPLVVVIDDFCNFGAAHVRPVIQKVWHQGMDPAKPKSQEPSQHQLRVPKKCIWTFQWARGLGEPNGRPENTETYGAVLDIASNHAPFTRPDDELSGYLDAASTELGVPPRWTHGAAVLYLMCKRGDDSPHARDRGRDQALIGTNPDGALSTPVPSAVEFVQLPDTTVLDTSGGSLGAFALDGIHRAVRTAAHGGHDHVIVNMSFGTHGGPHDGSSMFERAMLEMLDIYNGRPLPPQFDFYNGHPMPQLHIVLPAGNSHLWQAHASRVVSHLERDAVFDWHVLPDSETDSFLELWFEAPERMHVTVTAPDGSTLTCCKGQVHGLEASSSTTRRAALIFPHASPNAKRGGMALLAVGPTRRTVDQQHTKRLPFQLSASASPRMQRERVEAPAGLWRVKVRYGGADFSSVHAWVQRADAAPGRPRSEAGMRGRQSYLLEGGPTPPDPRFTLNGIATATHSEGRLHVVGAMDSHGHLARYSAAGPNRDHGERMGPSVVAVVGDSRNREGRFTGGVLSGSAVRLSGTSMAAAVYSRMLHDQLLGARPLQWPIHEDEPDTPVAQGEPEHAHPYLRGVGERLKHRRDMP